jgi:hypothetical protein
LGEGLAEGWGEGCVFFDAPDGVGLGIGDFLGVGFGVVDLEGVAWVEINDVEGDVLDLSRADAMPHPNAIVQKQTTKKKIRVINGLVHCFNFNISNFFKAQYFQ